MGSTFYLKSGGINEEIDKYNHIKIVLNIHDKKKFPKKMSNWEYINSYQVNS